MGYLDQAIEAFSRACESADGDIMPPRHRTAGPDLPLRGRDADAALVWRRGLEDPDPAVETAVRTRLRRAFGGDEVPAGGEGADPTWWEGFVEAAVCYGTLPLLANEIFGALDQMYSLAALPLAQGGGRARDLREILLSAVRVPSQYAWARARTKASGPASATPWAPAPMSCPPTGPISCVCPGGDPPGTPRCAAPARWYFADTPATRPG